MPLNSHPYVVQNYYTEEISNKKEINDNELTPLYFYNGKLIGWGRELSKTDLYLKKISDFE